MTEDNTNTDNTDTTNTTTFPLSPSRLRVKETVNIVLDRILPVDRARSKREEWKKKGLEGEALELLVGADAPKRAQQRQLRVLGAVFSWVLTWEEVDPDKGAHLAREAAAHWAQYLDRAPAKVLLQSLGLLRIEQSGVGGTRDCQGLGTLRHPGLDTLGKGRKQASDGPAWNGAIEKAAARLTDELDRRDIFTDGALCPNPSGVGLSVFYAQGTDPTVLYEPVPCLHPRWMAAYAAKQILEAGEGGDVENIVSWGRLYNWAKEKAHLPLYQYQEE